MNRAERRKMGQIKKREPRQREVRLTVEDINDIKERISDEASIATVDTLMTCFALAERRVYKFGKKRLKRTIDYIDSLVDDIVNGKATLEDYKKALKEEADVTIVPGS